MRTLRRASIVVVFSVTLIVLAMLGTAFRAAAQEDEIVQIKASTLRQLIQMLQEQNAALDKAGRAIERLRNGTGCA